MDAIEGLPVPTLGVIEGFALAGGLELALVCDLLIASNTAQIGDQHANYGLVAGGGATQRLPEQIPRRLANELLFTGNRISGTTAEQWGLVNRSVAPEQLDAEVSEFEESLTSKSCSGAELTKELVQKGLQTDMENGLEIEQRATAEYIFSEDPREGFAAFKEGREPNF
jgi:enoyl-CoA hydratase